jgi:protein TonB
MLVFFTLALAASSSPVPVTPPSTWVDYPPSALRNGEQGVVAYEVKVDASGKPTDCRVIASSGFSSLDGETCRQILRRGRFRPAMSEVGNAEPGTYASSLSWSFKINNPHSPTSAFHPLQTFERSAK